MAGVVFLLVDSLGSHKEPQLSAETTQPTQTQEVTQPTQTQEATEPTEKKKALAPDFTVYDREGNPESCRTSGGRPWFRTSGPATAALAEWKCLILRCYIKNWEKRYIF